MNAAHDMGGMQAFGEVTQDACDAPGASPFHAEWEKRVSRWRWARRDNGTSIRRAPRERACRPRNVSAARITKSGSKA